MNNYNNIVDRLVDKGTDNIEEYDAILLLIVYLQN